MKEKPKDTRNDATLKNWIRTADDTIVDFSLVAVVRYKDTETQQGEVQLFGPSGQCLATVRAPYAARISFLLHTTR